MSKLVFDVHKKTSTYGYLSPTTDEPEKRRIRTDKAELAKLLSEFPQPWVVYVESSRESSRFCRWAKELGAEVHMLHAGKLRMIADAMGAKTDGRDACVMVMLTYSGSLLPLEVYVAPDDVVEDRSLSRGRQVLRKISTLLRNVLRVILHLNDVDVTVTDLQGKAAKELWGSWCEQLPPKTRLLADILWKLLAEVEASIGTLDAAMRAEAKVDPVVQALEAIPGIGRTTAFQIVAEIGDISRFADPKALVSYAGLAPMSNDSDGFRGTRRLSNRCNKRLRYLLVQAAQAASRCTSPNRAREAYRRVRVRWDPCSSKIAGAREIAADIFYTWKRVNEALAAASSGA